MSPPLLDRLNRAILRLYGPLLAALAAAWLLYVLRNYEIRAFSDPMNWLHYARNLGTEIHTSRWPLGFPVVLRAVLDVAGPYAVFLVNVPILLGVFVLSTLLGLSACRTKEGVLRWPLALMTLAIFFRFDAPLVVQLANPYRDPLSYLLVLGALLLLVRQAAAGGGALRPALAGLLLGLACCVRETSILLLPPIGLFALWSWRANRSIRFWRDALVFSAALLAGLAPLLWQSYLSTGQAILPPQSAQQETLVPGMNYRWESIRSTVRVAQEYYRLAAGPFLLAVLAGAGMALGRRNRVLAGLILPAMLVHALFYACYWTFVRRYFYAAAIFGIPLAAWGILALAAGLTARTPERVRLFSQHLLALLAVLLAMVRLLGTQPDEPPFQIPQARAFTATIERHVPADSLVFCRRPLCEMVRWFTPARAFPATSLISADAPAEEALRMALTPYWEDPHPIFLLEISTPSEREVDAALMARIAPLHELQEWPADEFHFQRLMGSRVLRLSRVSPPSPDFQPAPPPTAPDARVRAVHLDFSIIADPSAAALLQGAFVPPTLSRNVPRVSGPATITLPGPLNEDETGCAEIRLKSVQRQSSPLQLSINGSNTAIPQDRQWHTAPIVLRGPQEHPALNLDAPGEWDLHRILWSIPLPSERLEVDVGSEQDYAFLREGWHPRERTGEGAARWTKPQAALHWRAAAPGSPVRLILRHHAHLLPPGNKLPALFFNGKELAIQTRADASAEQLEAEVPASLVRLENNILIATPGWTPGGGDTRTLGLFVDRITIEPAGARP